jgi:hypothetical protein
LSARIHHHHCLAHHTAVDATRRLGGRGSLDAERPWLATKSTAFKESRRHQLGATRASFRRTTRKEHSGKDQRAQQLCQRSSVAAAAKVVESSARSRSLHSRRDPHHLVAQQACPVREQHKHGTAGGQSCAVSTPPVAQTTASRNHVKLPPHLLSCAWSVRQRADLPVPAPGHEPSHGQVPRRDGRKQALRHGPNTFAASPPADTHFLSRSGDPVSSSNFIFLP